MKVAAKMLLAYALESLANAFKTGNYTVTEIQFLQDFVGLQDSEGIDNALLTEVIYAAQNAEPSKKQPEHQVFFNQMIKSSSERFLLSKKRTNQKHTETVPQRATVKPIETVATETTSKEKASTAKK